MHRIDSLNAGLDPASKRAGRDYHDGPGVGGKPEMTAAAFVACIALTALISLAGTGLVRRYAIRSLLDVPNERSSHSTPTPRGGGVAVAVSHIGATAVCTASGLLSIDAALPVAGIGFIVALVGFIDDHGNVPAGIRLCVHIAACSTAALSFGGLPPIDFGWGIVEMGAIGTAVMILYLTWYLNLFNFMDGIDGIAATQILTMAFTAVGLLTWLESPFEPILTLALLAAATSGFLVWNWAPAKIFLGDAGSGYLGFSIGAIATWTVTQGWLTPWTWIILGGAFLADATVTLIVRLACGESWSTAHRRHAYQRLSRHWRSHSKVTWLFVAVNILWLAPLAGAATVMPRYAAACALIALTPLFLGSVALGAGRPGDLRGGRHAA